MRRQPGGRGEGGRGHQSLLARQQDGLDNQRRAKPREFCFYLFSLSDEIDNGQKVKEKDTADDSTNIPVLLHHHIVEQNNPSQSQFFSRFQFHAPPDDDDDNDGSTTEPGPLSQVQVDDELQLDAFDRELLAQSDGGVPGASSTAAPSVNGSVTMAPDRLRQDFFHGDDKEEEVVSEKVSPFFNSKYQTTPLRGLESSSSEFDLGSSSSPLTRLQPRDGIGYGPASFQGRSRATTATEGAQVRRPIGNQSRNLLLSPGLNPEFSPVGRQGSEVLPFKDIPISVRGIKLVSVNGLPDHFRSLFRFPLFNAIQSKCFQPVYSGNDNVVLAAPTGSGKTVVMELAICRLLNNLKDERFKVVYQAPTKSLCAERYRDWNTKFLLLGLQCAELTGDTDHSQLKSVQSAQIIITTPEKWDSMTRKWKDHSRLMQLVKLFLIDEVHILKETRGATLEAVVSRMKSFGSNVRFVALSATVPNSEDIATWLGKDATNQHIPAHREHFGEDFRPVRLQKFVYGYRANANDFAFDKLCGSKLPDVIGMHSCKKPIMIFCSTRNSAVTTAKELARLWSMMNPPARLWKGPSRRIHVQNSDLNTTITAGVAFHHAGLDPGDRHTIETGFLDGQVSIICCTSTLAVGVNLPCHLVVIKNTVGWQEGGCREYSDLEMMQMLGRAGRPQFDDSACAVILTRKERVDRYERLVSGSENIESCLHLNLIDHLNAEIGLGTVTDIESAVKWLAGTFLFVRLRRNPTHYKLKEGANPEDEDEMLRQICEKDIKLLQDTGLVSTDGTLRSTQFGDAMARYYVRFDTMKTLLTLKRGATVFEILTVIAQADEFREIRLKSGEKSLYKEINKANGIRFPIKVDIALPAHKISLLVQSELGGVEFPDGEQLQKHRFSFQQDKSFVFNHISRLIRCVIDCQICLGDSVAIRNALELTRSFAARVWDDSPLQMKQIDQIGVVAVRKLAAAGITSIEALELAEAHQIDMILSKNPPFGLKLLSRVGGFPKLRVSVKMVGKETRRGNPVKVRFKAEVGFMNERVPTYFQRRPIYVCFLAETTDGRAIDFRRISANKLHSNGNEIPLIAELKSADQDIRCYTMCDEIAGTLRQAELKIDIPASFFPPMPFSFETAAVGSTDRSKTNVPPCSAEPGRSKTRSNREADAFDGDDLFDDFMPSAQRTDWVVIDDEANNASAPKKGTYFENSEERSGSLEEKLAQNGNEEETVRLANGRWACNHKCKDKTSCKHFCCREGLEKLPRASKKQQSVGGTQKRNGLNQLTLSASMAKKDPPAAGIPVVKRHTGTTLMLPEQHLTGKLDSMSQYEQADLSVRTPPISQARKQTPQVGASSALNTLGDNPPHFSCPPKRRGSSSSDYGDDGLNNLPSPSLLLRGEGKGSKKASRNGSNDKTNERKINSRKNSPDISVFDTEWIDVDEWLPLHSELDVLAGRQNETCKSPRSPRSTAKPTRDEFPDASVWSSVSKPDPVLKPDTGSTSNLSVTGTTSPAVDHSYHDYIDTPCGQKRKFHPDENENENEKGKGSGRVNSILNSKNEKRLKQSEPLIIDLDEIEPTTPGHNYTNHCNHDPEMSTLQASSGTVAVKDWDDIDPVLLDEFKDIVDFL